MARVKILYEELVGKTFGELFAESICVEDGRTLVAYRCACGMRGKVRPTTLLGGKIRTCGCKFRKTSRNQKKVSPERTAHKNMISRCCNQNDKRYVAYGAKGITIYEPWLNFEAFLAAVGPRPSPKHSLDRFPNNYGNYEPGNVRWATRKEQQRNISVNRLLTLNGDSLCVAEWAEKLYIPSGVLYARCRLGWSDEEILTTPVRKKGSF